VAGQDQKAADSRKLQDQKAAGPESCQQSAESSHHHPNTPSINIYTYIYIYICRYDEIEYARIGDGGGDGGEGGNMRSVPPGAEKDEGHQDIYNTK
jgi:hypothetical protein